MFSIKQLHYLIAVADKKSFSKAALSCNVTQSTLSLGIQELERQMDVILFERSRKHIIPTPAGTKAISYARKILDQSDHFEQEMKSLSNPHAGPLKIGIIPTIAPYFLPRFFPIIEPVFPESHIHISENQTATIIDHIHQGKIDLGVMAFPIETGDLETSILFEEPFYLACPRSMKIGKSVCLEDIKDQEILLLRDGHCLKDHILSACRLSPHKQNQFFNVDSLYTLLVMVNHGYGMTLVPEMALSPTLKRTYPHIKIIPFTGQDSPKRQIGLAWRRTDLRRQLYLSLDF